MPVSSALPTASPIAQQLHTWRVKVLDGVLRGTVVFWLLALASGINRTLRYYHQVEETFGNASTVLASIIAFYMTCLAVIVVAAFYPRVRYNVRAGILLFTYYAIGAFGLVFSALSSSGREFLFAFVLMAALLFSPRAGAAALLLSLFTFSLIGWLELSGQLRAVLSWEIIASDFSAWTTVVVVFAVLSIVVIISIGYLLNMLARTLADSHAALAHTQRLSRIIRTLGDINQLIVRERDRERLLKAACEILVREREYAFAWVSLVTPNGATAQLVAASEEVDAAAYAFQMDNPAGGPHCAPAALRTRTPVRIEPGEHDPCPTCPMLARYPQRSAIALPLISHDRLLGTLSVVHTTPAGVFDDEEVKLLQELADDIAFALNTLAAEEQHRAQSRFVSVLNDITRAALSAPDFHSMLQTLADQMAELFRAEACHITLWDEARGLAQPGAAYGPLRENFHRLTSQPGEVTLTETTLRLGRVLVAEDLAQSEFAAEVQASLGAVVKVLPAEGAQLPRALSGLALPLCHGEQKLGAVLLVFVEPRRFSPDEVARAEQAATHVALALANARLLNDTQVKASELSRLNTALEHREAYFRALVENSAEGVAVLDAQGNFRYAAPAEERLTGYAIHSLIGQSAFRFIHPTDRARLQALFERGAQKPGAVLTTEYRLQRKDGAWRHFEVTGQNWLDDPRMAGIVLNYRDITERVQAEAELREREKYSQSLLRLSRNLERSQTHADVLNAALEEVRFSTGYQTLWVYLFTEDRESARVLIAGGGAANMILSDIPTLKIAGDAFLEEIASAVDIVVVNDARTDPRTDKAIVEHLGNRTIVNVPVILLDKHLGTVGTGTFGDEGVRAPTAAEQEFLMAMASHMAVALDRIQLLTERAQTEAQLRESGNLLQHVFASLNEAVLVVHAYTRVIIDCNPATETLTGASRAELVGHTTEPYYLSHDDFMTFGETARQAILAVGQYEGQHLLRRKSGEIIYTEFFLRPMLDSLQTEPRLIAVIRDITAHKKAEEALRASEMQFRALAENIPSVVYQCQNDPQHTFTYLNDAIEALTGYPKEDFLSGRISAVELYHPNDAKRIPVPTLENQTAINKGPFHITYRFRHKSGEWRWVDEWGTGVTNAQDEVLYVQGVMIDITKRVQAQERIAELAQFNENIVASAPVGVITMNRAGQVTSANPAFLKMVGSPGLAETLQLGIGTPTVQKAGLGLAFQKTLTDGTPFEARGFPYTSHWGVELLVNVQGAPLTTEAGGITGLLVVVEDVTATARAEIALRQRADELEALVATSLALRPAIDVSALIPVVVVQALKVVNGDYGSVFLREPETDDLVSLGWYAVDEHSAPQLAAGVALRHPLGEGITGHVARTGQIYITDDLPRDPLARILPEEAERMRPIHSGIALPLRAHEQVIGVLHLWLREQRPFSGGEVRLLTALADMASAALHRATLFADLQTRHTELEQAVRRARALALAAEEANRLKSEFLANTSHELRTPLTAIIGSLELILTGLVDSPQEQLDFLRMAQRSAQGLREIVEQILDAMRLEAQKMDVRPQLCDMALIVEEVRWKVQPAALAKNLALTVDLPPRLPRAWADPEKVRQVLLILAENAIKFTTTGGVTLRVEPPSEAATLLAVQVSDTGVGIPPERQAKLFQPFVQADGSHTRQYGGLGLGLSISRRLAELMGGALTLHSAGLGQGTTITLTLPLVGEAKP